MSNAELNQKDLEKAVGGTFTLNYYWQSEYEEAGINGRAGVSAYWPLKAL